MKNFLRMGFAMIIGILTHCNVSGQNPNWTLPGQSYDHETDLPEEYTHWGF